VYPELSADLLKQTDKLKTWFEGNVNNVATVNEQIDWFKHATREADRRVQELADWNESNKLDTAITRVFADEVTNEFPEAYAK